MFQPAPLSIDPNEVLRYLGGGTLCLRKRC